MTLDLLKPATGQAKRPSEIRENMQYILGAALPDCIVPEDDGTFGWKVSRTTGLGARLSSGRGIIGKKYHDDRNSYDITLPARTACLIYRLKNTASDSLTPNHGYVQASFPSADSNTVCRFIIDGTGPISSTVGTYSLTKVGTLASVDAYIGQGAKNNGDYTNYYQVADSTGFPTADQEHILVVIPQKAAGLEQLLLHAADASGYNSIGIAIGSNGNWAIYCGGSSADTGYPVNYGRPTVITVGMDPNSCQFVSINGAIVYTKGTATINPLKVCLFRAWYSTSYYAQSIINFYMCRNKVYTPAQRAAMANALLLPCRSDVAISTYPSNPTDAGYHAWKFDETSGNTVTDEAGTINGTSINASIIDSGLGLGKARSVNGASAYINFGSYAFPSQYTLIFVGKIFSSNNSLLSNRASSTTGNQLYISAGNIPILYGNGGVNVSGTNLIRLGDLNFIAFTIAAGYTDIFVNGPSPERVGPLTPDSTARTLYTYDTYNASGVSATYEYLAIIPRALSSVEVTGFYNAFFPATVYKDIRQVIPADSHPVAFARTNATDILEISHDYRFGRREGITGGNRRQFLGWKYFSGGTAFSWDNPFGTEKCATRTVYKNTLSDSLEVDALAWGTNSSGNWGEFPPERTPDKFRITLNSVAYGHAYQNGAWRTSGYLGLWAEVLNND